MYPFKNQIKSPIEHTYWDTQGCEKYIKYKE